ncbi:hypothetical protein MCAMS1_00247 [biofilm metagenome]
MKILNLYFKNINSLEGENRIDFEQPPFSDTGVFAITGPNGSGKSSILDAITLALYGETFRFDKPAEHIITKHTSESFSNIEFVIGPDKYRSSWQVKRAGDNPQGEVLPTEMKLLRLSNPEEIVATTPQQVCSRMVEITGMNFRSFTRSILLAQGDFAAFLNALDSERMDILEKIISSDIYADYKKEVTTKLAETEQNLTYIQQDLAAVPLIEPQSLEACQHDLADFNEQSQEFQQEVNQLTAQKALIAETAGIRNQIETYERQLQEAITQRLTVQKKLDQLADAESALHFKDDLEVSEKAGQVLAQEHAALTSLRNELKQIENTLALPGFDTVQAVPNDIVNNPDAFTEQKQAVDSIRNQVNLLNANWQSEIILLRSLSDQIADKQLALAEITPWLDEHAQDRFLVDNFPDFDSLNNVQAELTGFEEKKKALDKWSKSTSSALQKNKASIDKTKDKLEQLTSQLMEEDQNLVDILQGHTLEHLEELQIDQQERVKGFEELLNLAIANEKKSSQSSFFFGLFGKKAEPDRTAEELEAELAVTKEQHKQEENIRLSLEKSVYNDALIARMAHDRNHLVDGKPCPLCGSSIHPYVKHPPAPANAEQALLDQRIRLKRLTVKLTELEEQVKLAHRYAERNRVRTNQLQQVNARWLTLTNQLNVVSPDLDIKNTAMMRELLKNETTDLKNIESLLAKHKGTQNNIVSIKTAIDKNNAYINQLEGVVQTIDAEWQTEPQRIEETESGTAKLIQAEQGLLAKITDQLAQVGETMPAKGKEKALLDRLNNRRLDYESYATRHNNLTDELTILLSKQAAGEAQINAYQARLDEFNTQLHQEEVVGLHLALVEKQKFIADKERLIKSLEADSDSLNLKIANKMQGSQFTSLDEIKHILAMMADQPGLIGQKTILDDEVAQLGTELEKFYRELESRGGQNKPELSTEAIDLKLKTIHEKKELADLEAQRLERIINEQQQYKDKHSALLLQLENQQDQVGRAKADVAELTEENGMKFRRRVQERVVERLLSQTNSTLEKISGRYYLRQQPSDRGLALEIEDTFQGNVRRMPKTLSGGETFIVSLALALALSELASSGRSVDSLFLDEGFGNLDAESLYTVINTLEGLHAHGKTVGVISHVEAVQKRFKVQLQLVKKPNGLGELRKVS